MKVCIIGSEDSWHGGRLLAAFNRYGVLTQTVSPGRLRAQIGGSPAVGSLGVPMDDADFVLVRDIPIGSLEQIIFRMDALHVLEAMGVRVVNPPRSIERAVDKYLTSKLLELHGVSTPATIVTESMDEALECVQQWGQAIIKPLFGGGGKGMVRVEGIEVASRVFRALQLGRYVYYLQEYVDHGIEDIRSFIIDGRVVAAMIRRGSSWKTNVTQGATPIPYVPDAEVVALSIQAAQAIGTFYAGVDLLRDVEGRLCVLEVNSMPGWRGLQQTTAVDIAQALVDALLASD
ncbi:MAG TPA: RimK family alpha-L-glutamate ligase [bacterium]|nr:RimK family alpha-L-glutamate ligase [bacterium]